MNNRQCHENDKNTIITKRCSIFGKRHLQCFLIFWSYAMAYAMRVNLSVAIVAMTDVTNTSNSTITTYNWSERIRSLILSSFFWCYFLTQIPGGQLAQRYGGKVLLLQAILINALLTVLTPFIIRVGNWQWLCAVRVVQGITQGVMYPATHTMLAKWSPVEERGTLSTYCYSGAQFGTITMLATSGLLASTPYGWPCIFYTSGSLSLLWIAAWWKWGASSPQEYKTISMEERKLIENSLWQQSISEKSNAYSLQTPWKRIFTSPPFLVLMLVHCADNWGYWTLLTQIPSYMKYILDMDIKSNALLSALPYATMFALGFVFCMIAQLLEKHDCTSLTTSRKLFTTISQWLPMMAIVGLGYVPTAYTKLAVALLTLTVGLNSASYLGYNINHIDLSPNYAGILMGITCCVSNIMSFIAPLVVGFVVSDERDPNQWRIVFFIAGGIYFIGNLLYIIFGQAKIQSWNNPSTIEIAQGLEHINAEAQK